MRGAITALGGIGHTPPFLIPTFWTAMAVAIAVVMVELGAISFIRWKYMDTPPSSATIRVAVAGALVFACGILIDNGCAGPSTRGWRAAVDRSCSRWSCRRPEEAGSADCLIVVIRGFCTMQMSRLA